MIVQTKLHDGKIIEQKKKRLVVGLRAPVNASSERANNKKKKLNECVYKWILCAIFHTKVICVNGIKTSFHNTYTYAQQHTSKYQIERNKVVARDKCLRANDLSLLFFEHFFFFISFLTLLHVCYMALLPSHSIIIHSLFSYWRLCYIRKLFPFSLLPKLLLLLLFISLPRNVIFQLKSRLNRIRKI